MMRFVGTRAVIASGAKQSRERRAPCVPLDRRVASLLAMTIPRQRRLRGYGDTLLNPLIDLSGRAILGVAEASNWGLSKVSPSIRLDEFFLAVGDPLASRTSPPPRLDKAQMEERIKTIKALAPKYRMELLIP